MPGSSLMRYLVTAMQLLGRRGGVGFCLLMALHWASMSRHMRMKAVSAGGFAQAALRKVTDSDDIGKVMVRGECLRDVGKMTKT